jgi:hypothetical protein
MLDLSGTGESAANLLKAFLQETPWLFCTQEKDGQTGNSTSSGSDEESQDLPIHF